MSLCPPAGPVPALAVPRSEFGVSSPGISRVLAASRPYVAAPSAPALRAPHGAMPLAWLVHVTSLVCREPLAMGNWQLEIGDPYALTARLGVFARPGARLNLQGQTEQTELSGPELILRIELADGRWQMADGEGGPHGLQLPSPNSHLLIDFVPAKLLAPGTCGPRDLADLVLPHTLLTRHFHLPAPLTIAEARPEAYARNLSLLRQLEHDLNA
jgi:hypothetical protein